MKSSTLSQSLASSLIVALLFAELTSVAQAEVQLTQTLPGPAVIQGTPANANFQYTAYIRPRDRQWNRAWTQNALLPAIAAQKSRLAAASDLNTYCPGFASASAQEQNNCFVRLITGISAWESSNTPTEVGDNGASIGLMQIGTFNCKRERFSAQALKVPANNLACGARLAADLIARDGVISNEGPVQGRWGTTRVQRRGLGRGGWSVMMRNFTMVYRGKKVQVGRLQQIAGGMMSYKDPKSGSVAVIGKKRKILA